MLLTGASIVWSGYNSITQVLDKRNQYVFNKELATIGDRVSETLKMLKNSGLGEIQDYVVRAQNDVIAKAKSYRYGDSGKLIVFDHKKGVSPSHPDLSPFLMEQFEKYKNSPQAEAFSIYNPEGGNKIALSIYEAQWDWSIFFTISKTEFYKPRDEYLRKSIGIAAILVALIAIVVTIISKKITTPIIVLHQAAEKASSGSYTVRAQVESKDEIGSLAKIFNLMIENIESYATSMETKVRDRTKILENKPKRYRGIRKSFLKPQGKREWLRSPLVFFITSAISSPLSM